MTREEIENRINLLWDEIVNNEEEIFQMENEIGHLAMKLKELGDK